MEFVILAFLALPLLAFAIAARQAVSRQHATKNADAVLAGLFDGSPQVTFRETFATLPADLVTERAGEFGYRVVAMTERKDGRTLVLERVGD